LIIIQGSCILLFLALVSYFICTILDQQQSKTQACIGYYIPLLYCITQDSFKFRVYVDKPIRGHSVHALVSSRTANCFKSHAEQVSNRHLPSHFERIAGRIGLSENLSVIFRPPAGVWCSAQTVKFQMDLCCFTTDVKLLTLCQQKHDFSAPNCGTTS